MWKTLSIFNHPIYILLERLVESYELILTMFDNLLPKLSIRYVLVLNVQRLAAYNAFQPSIGATSCGFIERPL